MRTISLAAVQFSCSRDRGENVAKADRLVREAAAQGAQVVLLPELFETPYFCAVQSSAFLSLAQPLAENPTIAHFRRLAAELRVVIPVSVYERAGLALFNAVVVIDADGRVAGHYRKSHIPQAPGYEEKYYFRREIPALRRSRPLMAGSGSRSAGTSGSRRPRAASCCRGRSS